MSGHKPPVDSNPLGTPPTGGSCVEHPVVDEARRRLAAMARRAEKRKGMIAIVERALKHPKKPQTTLAVTALLEIVKDLCTEYE